MPRLSDELIKCGFTPEETRLGVTIENIVFTINRRIPIGASFEGVTMAMLKEELHNRRNSRATYTEDLLKSTLEKLIEHKVLTESNGKFYSITYYGK